MKEALDKHNIFFFLSSSFKASLIELCLRVSDISMICVYVKLYHNGASCYCVTVYKLIPKNVTLVISF